VSSGSETRLSDENGSDATTCTVALDILRGLRSATCHMTPDPASLLGGLWAATRHAVLCGPYASSIKKRLACLPMELVPYVLNVCVACF
jgi:hypothetical protein